MAKIAYLCSDLLFTSKIRESALGLGHEVLPARDLASFADAAAGADVVIVDLRRPDALAALDALAANPVGRERPAFGFCDHERTDLMEEARRRGCTPMAKGRFSADLKRLLDEDAAGDGNGAR
jgi:hypothetical protein